MKTNQILGYHGVNPIISVKTKKVARLDYLPNLILFEGKVYEHIYGDLFKLYGIKFGTESDDFIKIKEEYVEAVVDFEFINAKMTKMFSDAISSSGSNKIASTIYTYLMKDNHSGFIKIGKSKDVGFRERTLQSQKPSIELVAYVDRDIEKHLHLTYQSNRVRGEWFSLSESQIKEIVESYGFVNTLRMSA
jgi:hypothetical protein